MYEDIPTYDSWYGSNKANYGRSEQSNMDAFRAAMMWGWNTGGWSSLAHILPLLIQQQNVQNQNRARSDYDAFYSGEKAKRDKVAADAAAKAAADKKIADDATELNDRLQNPGYWGPNAPTAAVNTGGQQVSGGAGAGPIGSSLSGISAPASGFVGGAQQPQSAASSSALGSGFINDKSSNLASVFDGSINPKTRPQSSGSNIF